MANNVDPDQTAPSGAVFGSTLFAYVILSETLEYKILGHLLYSLELPLWGELKEYQNMSLYGEIGKKSVFISRHTIVAGYYGFTLDIHVSIRQPSVHPSVFRFRMITWVKHQWIFTKLGLCIDIVEIWFGIFNGQISSNFYRIICLRHDDIFVYIPPHDSGGVLWFHVGRPCVRPSVIRPSVCFSFQDDNLSKTSMDFHQTWYVHWYCGDLVLDC